MTRIAPETTAEWTEEIIRSVTEFFKTGFEEVRDTDEDRAVLTQAWNFVDIEDLKLTYANDPEALFVKVSRRLREAEKEIFQDRNEFPSDNNRFTQQSVMKMVGKVSYFGSASYEDYQRGVRADVEWENWTGRSTR